MIITSFYAISQNTRWTLLNNNCLEFDQRKNVIYFGKFSKISFTNKNSISVKRNITAFEVYYDVSLYILSNPYHPLFVLLNFTLFLKKEKTNSFIYIHQWWQNKICCKNRELRNCFQSSWLTIYAMLYCSWW